MKSPLALLEILDRETGDYVWKVVNGPSRGTLARRAVYLRMPTMEEHCAIAPCVSCGRSGRAEDNIYYLDIANPPA